MIFSIMKNKNIIDSVKNKRIIIKMLHPPTIKLLKINTK